jgi:ribonucleoside-diphosphate reductase alpha chain
VTRVIDEENCGPKTEPAKILHAMKHRGRGESYREACNRIAFALQDNNRHYHEYREILMDGRFWTGGRIAVGMGSTRQATPYNCFVSGTISDSYVDGKGSIADRLKEAMTTLRLGGGIGYDFSTLRPQGDLVAKLDTGAGGPVTIMELFNTVGSVTTGPGHRYGAQMGILRVDHPDIEAFIRCKQNSSAFRRFNLSIAVTDEFMQAVRDDMDFDLRFGGRIYKTVSARALWEMIMRSTYDWAEPGVFFVDRINKENNLWYCEEIASCNPCAEQPLPPFGACLLGSFNLVKYLKTGSVRVMTPELTELEKSARIIKFDITNWEFDWDLLAADIPIVVRAMDNVVDRARYPLAEQRGEAMSKRRMGLGVMGLANAAEALGYPYGSPECVGWMDKIGKFIAVNCYWASIHLAQEKGPFPLFDAGRYLESGFMRRMPDDIREGVAQWGIRNSHLTSIAPTGTISLCADNVSSGIEPVIFHEVDRPVETPQGPVIMKVRDYGVEFLGTRGKLAHEVSAQEHVKMLAAAQKWTDSSVSKTINMDGTKMGWEDFKQLYWDAYESGCKSCTTFNQTGMRMALLKPTEAPEPEQRDTIACNLTGSCE